MKRISAAIGVCAALIILPAKADDFLPQPSGASQAREQGRHPLRRSQAQRHRGAAFDIANEVMPEGARSFVASASYYGGGPRRFEPNSHTASGERFNQWDMTAAHRTLPIGTHLLVTHHGRSVVVRINDRGPAAWTGRSLDLSRGAATRIGLIASGTGAVQVQVLSGS